VYWDPDYADGAQPLLESVIADGTTVWKAGVANVQIFLTEAEATAHAASEGGSVTELMYIGREAWNWLRDANERICIYAALKHIGFYLRDTEMEARYEKETMKIIEALNREDKFRKAKGGNVQINVNSGGLI
jgi:hypothetical protein